MRIVALADSLSLPRLPEELDETIRWEDTWPYLLEQILRRQWRDVEVVNCGSRARTVETLLGEDFVDHIVLKAPAVVIVQIGVVDCAPRVISLQERQWLNMRVTPRFFRDWVIRRRSARRKAITARNPLARVYVPPARFRDCLRQFLNRLGELPRRPLMIWLPIVGDVAKMNQKSPGFSDNVQQYNRILKAFADQAGGVWFDWETSSDFFWEDGYHLGRSGNRALASGLAQHLSEVRGSSVASTGPPTSLPNSSTETSQF